MTRPLSDDLRRRVAAAVDDGMSRRGAAKRFGIAPSTAIKWVWAWRLTGSYRPRAQGGDRRSHRIEARAETVLALVEETPDMMLAEIAAHLEGEHGLRVSQSTVWRFFHRRGITFKKTAHASEQQRPDVLQRRRAWFEAQPALDPDRLVFVDETGASTKMARRCGRALRGHRCRAPVPHGHWKTTTFVGALRLSGMTAPMVLDGAMHGAAFLAYSDSLAADLRCIPVVSQAARIPFNRSSRCCCCCCACGDVGKARSGLSIISTGGSPRYASAGVRPSSAE